MSTAFTPPKPREVADPDQKSQTVVSLLQCYHRSRTDVVTMMERLEYYLSSLYLSDDNILLRCHRYKERSFLGVVSDPKIKVGPDSRTDLKMSDGQSDIFGQKGIF